MQTSRPRTTAASVAPAPQEPGLIARGRNYLTGLFRDPATAGAGIEGGSIPPSAVQAQRSGDHTWLVTLTGGAKGVRADLGSVGQYVHHALDRIREGGGAYQVGNLPSQMDLVRRVLRSKGCHEDPASTSARTAQLIFTFAADHTLSVR